MNAHSHSHDRHESLLFTAFHGILALIIMCIPSIASAGSPTPAFVPAEVMVKFVADSKAAQAFAKAIQSTPPDLERLAPTTRLLTEKTGIPVKAKQALSGGWLLLAVDMPELAKLAENRLRKHSAVADIQVKTAEPKGVGMPETYIFDVIFRPDSTETKAIEDKRAGSVDEGFRKLVSDLGKLSGLPLVAEPATAAHLTIEIDLRELTLRLSQRLKDLPELIESVNLNYITTFR